MFDTMIINLIKRFLKLMNLRRLPSQHGDFSVMLVSFQTDRHMQISVDPDQTPVPSGFTMFDILSASFYLLTGDRRQTKQFCFLDADCLVVGESQSSSRRSAGRYPVKPPRPEGDSQTIDTLQCRNSLIRISIIDSFASVGQRDANLHGNMY